MRTKRLISLALILALMLTLAPLSLGSHADEKRPTAEDFEFIPVEENYSVDNYNYFSEGLVAVRKDEKWGYIDGRGKVVIDYEYSWARPFHDGLAIVLKEIDGYKKWGLIDKKGEVVLPLEYEKIEFFPKEEYGNSEDLYRLERAGKYAIANSEGKIILSLRGASYRLLGEDRIFFYEDGKTSLFDIKGALLTEGDYEIYNGNISYSEGYDEKKLFNEGRAVVKLAGGNNVYIDKSGDIISPEYDFARPYYDGLAKVKKDGQYYFIDDRGNTLFELSGEEYYASYTKPFREGLAAVKSRKDDKWGFIDKTGKVVIPCVYNNVFGSGFSHGFAWVRKNSKADEYTLIDKNGKELLPFLYEPWRQANGYTEGLSRVYSLGKYGFMNEKGEVQILEEYNKTSNFKDGLAWARKGEKWFLINKRGEKVLDEAFYDLKYQNFNESYESEISENKHVPREPFPGGLALVKRKIDDRFKKLFIIRYKNYGGAQLSSNKDKDAKPADNKGYVYDEADKGEGLVLLTDELAKVIDKTTATEAVNKALSGATEEQKTSATGTDLFTLYGEEAALRTAKTEVEGSEFIIDKASVEKVEKAAIEAKTAVEGALKDGGVTVQRELSTGVIYEVKEGDKLNVKVDASSAEAKVGNVRVETPTYSLSFNKKALASIKDEDTTPLEITVTELPASSAELTEPRTENPSQSADFSGTSSYSLSQNAHPSYSGFAFPSLSGTHIPSKALGANILEDAVSKVFDIKFSKKIKEKIKLSLPVIKGNPNYQAVYDSEGKAIGGKYNPVTKKLDVKINKSDKYVVKEKKKSFSDITSKSKEMQDAIEILASKGIIAGTSPTNFSPDGTITRAEIAALILRSISKLNPSENGGFSDVTSADWYFGAVGSAKKHGIMNGVSKTLFSPKSSIKKEQIVAVAARVLKEEMGYLAPSGPEAFLGSYTDAASIPNWAKSDVALATREGLVVKRYDSAFIPAGTMTRGDVAVILHRLFKKLW